MIQVGLVNHIWKHGPVGGVKGGEGVGREDGLDVTGAVQWNFSINDTLNEGHLSNEDTVCSPNNIELCTNLPLK